MSALAGQSTLFETAHPEDVPGSGHYAQIALEQSLDHVLDYQIPERLVPQLRIGQRVSVPLGRRNRPVKGWVVGLVGQSSYAKLKQILDIDDPRVLVTPGLMRLSLWMSRYYCAALGTVLESVIPSAVKKRTGVGMVQIVRAILPHADLQTMLEATKAPKRRAILARLLQVPATETVELIRLANEANVTPATVRKLAKAGVIVITSEMDLPGFANLPGVVHETEPDIAFNDDQQRAFDVLSQQIDAGGFAVTLLHGVTGSGKTEVYLQCIRRVIARKQQAIVLVPEIALTPQTARRFTLRFPRVAILHSGLSQTERHRQWQTIAAGGADVVVGARSAIFAPLPNNGLIVVDEEHESSYKQDAAPRYHARDVAIKRAQIEGIPVLLGTATPSLETWHRAGGEADASGTPPRYTLLSLPRRVRGLALPHVELVDLKQEVKLRRGVHMLSTRLEHLLHATLDSGKQAILLLNRRGYSNFIYCPSCMNVVQCKYCDTTMTYHRSAGEQQMTAKFERGKHTGQMHCHYCLAVNPLPEKCPDCGKMLSLFGLGTQRVEEELMKKFPGLPFARVDSDTMRNGRDYEALLNRFGKGEIKLMVGTQMIAKGLDYPNVTLVGVISGDTALALPDFRAAERTFQLITQVAGRAGRGDAPGRVVLQTFLPDDPTIQSALRHDFLAFASNEIKNRRDVGLPPFSRMVRIILRDENQEQVHRHAEELTAELAKAADKHGEGVRLRGPMPCAISRIAGYWRDQILLTSPSPGRLQEILAEVRAAGGFSKTDRVAVDVDPVSLL